MAKWNEVGPPTLTDKQIYDRHFKLLDNEVGYNFHIIKQCPYVIIDPLDHLYNPAWKIRKYTGHGWVNKEWNDIAKVDLNKIGDKDLKEDDQEEDEENLYPIAWNNALLCIFQNNIKSKFQKKLGKYGL